MAQPVASPAVQLRRRSSDFSAAAPVVRTDLALETLLAEDRLTLAFQPQLSVATGEVIGVEVLARDPGGMTPSTLR